jgi:hypothetical protein
MAIRPGLMIVLQPFDVGADRGRAGLDATVIGVDVRLGRGGLAGRVAEIANDIIMQRALVALQGQGVPAALIDDLPGNLALTVERVDRHNGAL